jgi:hypothetical protein
MAAKFEATEKGLKELVLSSAGMTG